MFIPTGISFFFFSKRLGGAEGKWMDLCICSGFCAFGFSFFFVELFSFKLTSTLLPLVSQMSVQASGPVSCPACAEPSDCFLTACSYQDTREQ